MLDQDPHPVLRLLRATEPVSWLPALGGWLVTRRDLALRVLRDPAVFTVDDPRFTTARVVGPSMLSLDGAQHKRHRDPFAAGLREAGAGDRLPAFVEAAAVRLVAGIAGDGAAELRRSVAGPLAVAVVAEVLGLGQTEPDTILAWYDAIVGAVSGLAGPDARASRGQAAEPGQPGAVAFGRLRASLEAAMASGGGRSLLGAIAGAGELSSDEVVSNAAVLMFGGIETTEGMICNAVWHLLRDPGQAELVTADPELAGAAIDESLRLEPAAAVVDRYATADIETGGAPIRRGDLVTVSLAGANRDPEFFPEPDRFDLRRANVRQQLAFARGPHFCIGAQLATLEARAALSALLGQLPGLRLDPGRPAAPRGLVFRKPPELWVQWDRPAATPAGPSASPGPASSQ
jgi:cytochrome P450